MALFTTWGAFVIDKLSVGRVSVFCSHSDLTGSGSSSLPAMRRMTSSVTLSWPFLWPFLAKAALCTCATMSARPPAEPSAASAQLTAVCKVTDLQVGRMYHQFLDYLILIRCVMVQM